MPELPLTKQKVKLLNTRILSNHTLNCNGLLMKKIKILAFYKFTKFDFLASIKKTLLEECGSKQILGSVLIANEGINGTVAGTNDSIDALLLFIKSLPGCQTLEYKFSFAKTTPFLKLRVRLKKEIVSMGQPQVKPSLLVGNYIDPENWNAFTSDDDVIVIDTRNDYEVSVGTFPGSINPKTDKFRDFPEWWDKNSSKFKNKKIAMFCTGGIRCEKATNFILQRQHKEVYHLKGGILKYLETVKEETSNWKGECFVFDQRVSVKHNLIPGSYSLCYACRRPLSNSEKLYDHYEEGVSCHRCYNQHSTERKDGFRERQRQIYLNAQKN